MLGKHHYFNKESYLKKCHADAFCPQEMDTFCRCGLLCSLAVSGLRPRNDSRACGRRELEETPALAGLWLGCHDTGALSPPLLTLCKPSSALCWILLLPHWVWGLYHWTPCSAQGLCEWRHGERFHVAESPRLPPPLPLFVGFSTQTAIGT